LNLFLLGLLQNYFYKIILILQEKQNYSNPEVPKKLFQIYSVILITCSN